MPLDSSRSVIRLGNPQDLAATVELGRAMASEGWYSGMPYDGEYTLRYGAVYTADQNRLFIVSECDRQLTGFFLGHLVPYFFMQDYFAEEFLWYVLPEARKSLAGLRLFETFEKWAALKKSREIICNPTIEEKSSERIGAWLLRKGYTFIGGAYRRKLR